MQAVGVIIIQAHFTNDFSIVIQIWSFSHSSCSNVIVMKFYTLLS